MAKVEVKTQKAPKGINCGDFLVVEKEGLHGDIETSVYITVPHEYGFRIINISDGNMLVSKVFPDGILPHSLESMCFGPYFRLAAHYPSGSVKITIEQI